MAYQIKIEDIPDVIVRNWYKNYYKKPEISPDEKSEISNERPEFSIISTKYPHILEVESTSRCNVNPPCPMCGRAVRDLTKETDMPDYFLKWLMTTIRNVEKISISGVGEPMISQSFYDMINIKSSADLYFFSNGQILTQKNIDIILERPVTNISFSIDAATPNTYRKIRGFDMLTFDTVIKNISLLIKLRNERNQELPSVTLVMVLMKENYQELPDLVTLAGEIGANIVSCWRLCNPSSSGDYKNHSRFDFYFSHKEQSDLPDIKGIFEEAYFRAKNSGVVLRVRK